MLKKVKKRHHVAVGITIAGMTLLAGFRIVGGGDDALIRPESFDAKQVTIWPDDDGIRIREVVDIDFGPSARHGYQRIIPNDFGTPEQVEATSDANSDVDVYDMGFETRIRIGDPVETFTGRHRYVLEYVLPEPRLESGTLALDVIGTDETFETERFEVVLTGFEFSDTACDTGSYGAFGGCALTRDDAGRWVTTIEPLAPNEGITVGGTIDSLSEPDLPPVPDPPARTPGGFSPLGLLMIPVGVAGAAAAYFVDRRRGRNEVAGGGGAAEAAYGNLPAPGSGRSVNAATLASASTRRVTDAQLAQMATIEFVPPRGLEPWQGRALLQEQVDQGTVLAWFSEMIAAEALVIDKDGSDHTLRPGPKLDLVDTADKAHISSLFASKSSIELGAYDSTFASTWRNLLSEQKDAIRESGWWSSGVGSFGPAVGGGLIGAFIVIVVLFGVNIATFASSRLSLLASPWVAIVLGAALPFFVGLLAYSSMLPARTATGSALALRTESFRRFLDASEGQHVQWAWDNNLLREYSAWAVALDAADAWERAIAASNISDPGVALNGPLLAHSLAHTMSTTSVQPSSSGGSGGGFSGGGVGGGGGGGSSGSW